MTRIVITIPKRKYYLTIYKLENTIQEYAWGHTKHIADLLGIENKSNKPLAELWMGAHPKAPSKFVDASAFKSDLFQLINNNPTEVLGKTIMKRFGRLPFLFKVLAAGSPLSIQAHPNLKQAKVGFERENKLGIALDAFNRNYKDDNHKPELMCALTTFKALNGFRPIEEIEKLLSPAKKDIPTRIWNKIEDHDPQCLKELFTFLITMEKEVKTSFLNEIIKISLENKDQDPGYDWVLKLNSTYAGDIGIVCPLILNLIELEPGEAVFLDAGRLHSYLEGLGVELMANSDNVLRGGLTPKFVDVIELLSILEFDVSKISKVKVMGNDVENQYPKFTDEFQLSLIDINQDKTFTSRVIHEPSIFICINGQGTFKSDDNSFEFKKGDSFFASFETYQLNISGNAQLFRAFTPLDK
ncbi:MAG: mannose-6-phosphate isomerase, class I [Planctomycetota bacterium]|nr:MAG: mannose-6-phosphate isomerase, class I [Planctomycetota bacterium]